MCTRSFPVGGIVSLAYQSRGHLARYVGIRGGYPGWLKPDCNAFGGDWLIAPIVRLLTCCRAVERTGCSLGRVPFSFVPVSGRSHELWLTFVSSRVSALVVHLVSRCTALRPNPRRCEFVVSTCPWCHHVWGLLVCGQILGRKWLVLPRDCLAQQSASSSYRTLGTRVVGIPVAPWRVD